MFAYYVHNLSPFLIQFSDNWGLRWYGLSYAAGFVLASMLLQWQAQRGYLKLPPLAVSDYLSWIIGGVLIGGRLGYCLFYDFDKTMHDPVSVIAFWRQGGFSGMASHGGVLGVILVIYLFARRQKISFWQLADATVLATPLGLFLGRCANFINGELWGRPTDVPWAVVFANTGGGNLPRHPSQLYEAGLEGLLLFAVLWWMRPRVKQDGWMALTFVGGYGLVRIFGELFREPDVQIGYYWGGITQGQILSFGMVLTALILAGFLYFQGRNPEKS
jgi:phosphatidylglycerol:prolipoprotein diacylglycerol transferase